MFIVTKKIDSENISRLCRTCLREDDEKMIYLFVGPPASSLAAKLRSFSCLEVWQGDGLPEKLCNRCVTRTESALLFREQCRAADSALRQAAARVDGYASCTTVSNYKLFQQNQELTSLQTSTRPIKCLECEAVFMDNQELYFHSRSHSSVIRKNFSLPRMHVVETKNSHLNLGSQMDSLFINPSKNNRTTHPLHYSVYNYKFPNHSQLINNHFSRWNSVENPLCDSSIEVEENSSNPMENFSFQRLDLQFSREEYSSSLISRKQIPQNLMLLSKEQEINGINKKNLPISTNQIFRSRTFSQDIQTDNILNSLKSPLSSENFGVQMDTKYVISLNTKKHQCKICKKSFSQKSKLITHELSHTGERPFKCYKCNKNYASKSKFNAHMRLHTRINIHQCNICNKKFTFPSYLIEHSKIHEKNSYKFNIKPLLGTFECSTCSKKFRLKKNLKAHIKLHSGKNLFYCEICHKPFSQKFNLKIHLKSHENIRTYKCEYCDRSFNGKGNYIEHLRIHTKIKPFVCQLCDKSFSQSSHLKTHKATHDSLRPYECRICNKKFKLLSHLKRHINIHSNVKKFKCNQCNQSFSQAFSLKRHLKKHNEVN